MELKFYTDKIKRLPVVEKAVYQGWIEKAQQEEFTRTHLGASEIGSACPRKVYYSYHWATSSGLEGRMYRLFHRGHKEEETIVAELKRLEGFCVYEAQKDGTQYRFVDLGGHFAGSCDGIVAVNREDLGLFGYYLLEMKTHSIRSFEDLERMGVQMSKPQHWAQIQVYLNAFGLEKALYYGVCKNDDRIYIEEIEGNPAEAARWTELAKSIIWDKKAPPPISEAREHRECTYCPFKQVCVGEKEPRKNCRTCKYFMPKDGKKWHCNRFDEELLPLKIIRGCKDWERGIE